MSASHDFSYMSWLEVLEREIAAEDYPEIIRTLGLLTYPDYDSCNRLPLDQKVRLPAEIAAVLLLGGKLCRHPHGMVGLDIDWSRIEIVDSSNNVI